MSGSDPVTRDEPGQRVCPECLADSLGRPATDALGECAVGEAGASRDGLTGLPNPVLERGTDGQGCADLRDLPGFYD